MIRLSVENAVIELAARLAGTGGRVFVQGGMGEPAALHEAFAKRPDLAAGLTFVTVQIPGVNRLDWAGLHPGARAEGVFVSPDWRASFEAGRFAHRPMGYGAAWGWLARTPLDAAVVQVGPPDADRLCSLGLAADYAMAVLERPLLRMALVNPNVFPTPDAPRVALDRFDLVAEAERPPLAYDPGRPDPTSAAIAARVADLMPEAATVQIGLGKVGSAMLAALEGRRGLRLHSGMVTDAVLGPLDAGAFVDEPGSVVIGSAFGSPALYRRCAEDRRIRLAPYSFTHDAAVLAAIPRLVAVNSALEVDLFGQANAEFTAGRQVSGVGGQAEFLRGAARSDGGLPILALASTARGGTVSRIAPRLDAPCVTLSRNDIGVVVTEHGAADLRGLTLDGRAEALIALAAPEHRDGLATAWAAMRRAL